jgi:hypothetical protein
MPESYHGVVGTFNIGNKLLSFAQDDLQTLGAVFATAAGAAGRFGYGELLVQAATGKWSKAAATDYVDIATAAGKNFSLCFSTDGVDSTAGDASGVVLLRGAVNAQGITGYPVTAAAQFILNARLRDQGLYVNFVVPSLA